MLRIILKESREQQLRRELDDVVNGTDYGAPIEQADKDPTVARAKGLEIDDQPIEIKPDGTKPSSVGYWPNGRKRYERYVVDYNFQPTDDVENFTVLHRVNGPALISWDQNGQKRSETWAFNDVEHRTDGPSHTRWYQDGQKELERFNFKGENHRIGAPAITTWNPDGRKSSEHFFKNGKRHNAEGPAVIMWGRHGEKEDEAFYLDDVFFPKKDWERQVAKLNRPPLDLDEPPKEYKFTKNRKEPSDPRFAGLDLADNQPPQKTDDKELGNRAQGLEVEPPKERDTYKFSKNRKSPSDPRFKSLELDEKLNLVGKEFKKLL